MQTLDKKLSLRVNKAQYAKFTETCRNVHGRDPQILIRELIVAVSEGRVKITPTEEQLKQLKQSTELYNVN